MSKLLETDQLYPVEDYNIKADIREFMACAISQVMITFSDGFPELVAFDYTVRTQRYVNNVDLTNFHMWFLMYVPPQQTHVLFSGKNMPERHFCLPMPHRYFWVYFSGVLGKEPGYNGHVTHDFTTLQKLHDPCIDLDKDLPFLGSFLPNSAGTGVCTPWGNPISDKPDCNFIVDQIYADLHRHLNGGHNRDYFNYAMLSPSFGALLTELGTKLKSDMLKSLRRYATVKVTPTTTITGLDPSAMPSVVSDYYNVLEDLEKVPYFWEKLKPSSVRENVFRLENLQSNCPPRPESFFIPGSYHAQLDKLKREWIWH